MKAGTPTTIIGIARVMIGLACLIIAQGLGRTGGSFFQAVAAQSLPAVIVDSAPGGVTTGPAPQRATVGLAPAVDLAPRTPQRAVAGQSPAVEMARPAPREIIVSQTPAAELARRVRQRPVVRRAPPVVMAGPVPPVDLSRSGSQRARSGPAPSVLIPRPAPRGGIVRPAPAVNLSPSAPQRAVVGPAPPEVTAGPAIREVIVGPAPAMDFAPSGPRSGIVGPAPAVDFARTAPAVDFARTAPASVTSKPTPEEVIAGPAPVVDLVPSAPQRVIVGSAPAIDLARSAAAEAVVRPAPAMILGRSMNIVGHLRLSDIAQPTPQTTVVRTGPPADTADLLRLSDIARPSPQSTTPQAEPSTDTTQLLRLSDVARGEKQTTSVQDEPSKAISPAEPSIETAESLRLSETALSVPEYIVRPLPPGDHLPPGDIGQAGPPPESGKPARLSDLPPAPPAANDKEIGPAMVLPQPKASGKPAAGADIVRAEPPEELLRLSDRPLLAPPAALVDPVTGAPAFTAQTKAPGTLAPRGGMTWGPAGVEEIGPAEVMPSGFEPWWQAAALGQLRQSPQQINVDVNSLIVDSLRYSAQIRAISDEAIIAQTAISRAAAEFDIHAFMETKLVSTNVPTSSTLDAGASATRLKEREWNYNAGLRKKNQYGGRFEIAQRIGSKNSTSQFFSPTQQGNSRLTLSYNQPLLNGGGEVYNSSLILLATVDSNVAADRTSLELQDQLLEVTESMWELYVQRSLLLQKKRHLERATTIYSRLEKRRNIDSLESQIVRARAAVATRRTELIRANTAIRNAESLLRSLVNSPDMLADRTSELVPVQAPASYYVPINLQDALATALKNRPDIDAAAQELEAARIRLKVARNELLPVLDAVLETYVSGLRDDYDISGAWSDQFNVGKPSYTAGLVFENPIHRRAAKANHLRRQVELRQLSNQFQATVETLNANVEVAVREVETGFREMQARYQSMLAAQSDASYLESRWESLPGDDRAASFMLEDLLDSQNRLAAAEFDFTVAQVQYTISLTYLNRATGSLLQQEQIKIVHGSERGLPKIFFEKAAQATELPVPIKTGPQNASPAAP